MVLMRIVDLLTLIVFIVPLPFIVYLQGGFYYYSDYVRSQIENDPSSEVFDFIVGKHILIFCDSVAQVSIKKICMSCT